MRTTAALLYGGDLTGDTSSSVHNIESRILSSLSQVELYKVHHHGSATSSSAALLNVIKPKVATMSMSATNGFGHPTATALSNIHAQNTTVYWTTSGNGASPGASDVVANNTIVTEVPAGGATFTMRHGSTTASYTSWGTGTTCSYALTANSVTVSAAGASGAVGVTAPTGCAWTATSSAGFASITSGSPGNGNGSVGYSVASAAHPRSGTLTIAGLTFTINQSAPAFTNDPVIAGTTIIRAVHLTEMRTRVDALRSRYGLSAYAWTDVTASGSLIRAIHITELRSALSAVYTAAGRSAPTFTDSDLGVGIAVVRAAHINEIRGAILAIE